MKLFSTLIALCILGTWSLKAQNSYNMVSSTGSTDTVGYLYDNGGPNGNYSSNIMGATFTINVGVGKTVRLQFLEFDTETDPLNLNLACLFDYVEVFDGPPPPISLNRYCGAVIPPVFTSTTGTIVVRFTSDLLNTRAGFKAFWSTDNLQTPPTDAYCDASGPSCATPNNVTIQSVQVDTINFVNNTCNNNLNGKAYSNYTDSVFRATALIPSVVNISTAGGLLGIVQVDVYVDWNDDAVFDPILEYYPGITVLNMTTAAIVAPTGVSNGLKRMRVRVYDPLSELGLLGPCGESVLGEVEDYSILYEDLLNPVPDCSAGATPSNNSLNVCLNTVLRWLPVADATGYKISLWDQNNNYVYNQFVTTDTALDVSGLIFPNSLYTWTITPTNNNGDAQMCDSLRFTTVLNLDPNVLLNPNGDPLVACVNDPVQIVTSIIGGTGGIVQTLTGPASQFLNNLAPGVIDLTGTVNGVFDLILEVVDANGCRSSDTTSLTIIDEVDAGVIKNEGSTKACTQSKFRFKVTGYQGNLVIQDSLAGSAWKRAPFYRINDSIFEVVYPTAGTVYFRSVANGTSCVDTSNNMVEILVYASPAPPAIVLSGNDTICEGQSMKLVVSNYNHSVLWNTTPTTLNDTLVVTKSGNYVATYLGEQCPSVSLAIPVYVSPAPAAKIDYSGSLTACDNEAPVLYANPGQGVSLVWNTGGNQKVKTAQSSGVHYATFTNAQGCSNMSNQIQVSLKPSAPKPVISMNGSAQPCLGEPVQLISSYGSNIKWSNGMPFQSITVFNPGSYQVTYTNNHGCKSVSDPYLLQFRPGPTRPKVQLNGSLNRCYGDTAQLNLATNYPVTWNMNNQLNTNPLPAPKPGTYFGMYIDNSGCKVYSDTIRLSYYQYQASPKIEMVGNPCIGSTVTLRSSQAYGNYWNNTLNNGSDSLVIASDGNYYIVNIQNGNCVAYSDTLKIVFEMPPLKPSVLSVGDSLKSDVEAYNYQWVYYNGVLPNSNSRAILPRITSDYQVIAYSYSGCASPLSERYYYGISAVDELRNLGISLYPNPSEGQFNIVSTDEMSYKVMSVLGQTITEGYLSKGQQQLNIEESSGMYLLQLNSPHGVLVTRIFKK